MTVVSLFSIKKNKILILDGSGCACCGTVFSGYIYKMMQQKKYKKVLLMATGALTNSTTNQQGESIPGIAHAIAIEL